MTDESEGPKEDSLAILKALAEASAIFIAVTFVGGWSYLASYYRTFGLNPLELDISIPVVSTIAVFVLYKSIWPLVVVAVVIALVAALVARQPNWWRWGLGRAPVVAGLVLVLFIVAAGGVWHGAKLAKQDMLSNSSTLPNVAFASPVENADQLSCVEHNNYGSLDCKLLLHFNNAYYYFQPLGENSDPNTGNLNVYRIEDSDVVAVQVQRPLYYGDPRIE